MYSSYVCAIVVTEESTIVICLEMNSYKSQGFFESYLYIDVIIHV